MLVLNTLPFAPPSALFSDALSYRFRLRPLTANARGDRAPFAVGDEEFVFDCVFSTPANGDGTSRVTQEGTCSLPTGEAISVEVNDAGADQAHGVRVFAGPRWDPFIMDAPAMLKTIATGKLSFTDPGSIFLDGKNVLSVVVEVDCAAVLGDCELVGVVAETVTRGKLAVRFERAGRPEVPNLMLGPKQFDPVNRDLEIRDLYNMEDAFHLAQVYPGRLPGAAQREPRFLGRTRRQDGLAAKRKRRSSADRVNARGLPRGRRYEAIRRAGVLPRDRTRNPRGPNTPDLRWASPLNDDVMDTIFTLSVNAGTGPAIRDGVHRATMPASGAFPYLAPPNPDPPDPPEHL